MGQLVCLWLKVVLSLVSDWPARAPHRHGNQSLLAIVPIQHINANKTVLLGQSSVQITGITTGRLRSLYHDYFIHLDLPPFLCSCLPNHLKDFTKTQKDCVTNSLSQDLRDLLNAVHHSLAFVLALIITFMIKIRFIFFKIMSRFSQNTLLLVRFLFLFLFFIFLAVLF